MSHDSVRTLTKASRPMSWPFSVPSGTITWVGASFLAPLASRSTTQAPNCLSRALTRSAAPPGCWAFGRGVPLARLGGGSRESLKA